MYKILTLAFTTVLFISLTSSKLNKTEKKIVGSWQVVNITLKDGRKKAGKKIVTFKKDRTTVSSKPNGRERYGSWSYDSATNMLVVKDDQKERTESFEIVTLTRKSLILKDDRKTFETKRVKRPKRKKESTSERD